MSDSNLNVTEKPLPSYSGSEPYIYVSYAPEDRYAVYPEIKRFQNQGFNVFYDEKGEDINVKELENCTVFIIFFTPNSAKLDRILEEVEFAEENQINILPIYLVETELDPLLDFTLSEINSISKFKWDSEKYTAQYMESFKGFGLKSSKNSLKSKLVPGQGRVPFQAYRGEGSYMFISYAHKDSDIVFPEIKRFQDMGYNVWYDEGIGAGNEWLKDVVNHLVGSDLFVVFITKNSVASKNVRKEIKYAIHKDKNILPIFLEDFDNIEMEADLEYELSVIQAIIKTGEKHDYKLEILSAVESVNNRQKKVLFDKLKRHFGDDLKNKTIAVWGLAFKPNTDDMREAPSIVLIKNLIAEGCKVKAYDPEASKEAYKIFGDKIEYAQKQYEILDKADALVIVTEWNEFRRPDFDKIKSLLNQPIIMDGRNLFDPKKMAQMGFTYEGIGRRLY